VLRRVTSLSLCASATFSPRVRRRGAPTASRRAARGRARDVAPACPLLARHRILPAGGARGAAFALVSKERGRPALVERRAGTVVSIDHSTGLQRNAFCRLTCEQFWHLPCHRGCSCRRASSPCPPCQRRHWQRCRHRHPSLRAWYQPLSPSTGRPRFRCHPP